MVSPLLAILPFMVCVLRPGYEGPGSSKNPIAFLTFFLLSGYLASAFLRSSAADRANWILKRGISSCWSVRIQNPQIGRLRNLPSYLGIREGHRGSSKEARYLGSCLLSQRGLRDLQSPKMPASSRNQPRSCEACCSCCVLSVFNPSSLNPVGFPVGCLRRAAVHFLIKCDSGALA